MDGLDADFALFAVGMTPHELATHAVRAGVDAVQHAMAPWSTGRCYLNFAERSKSGAALFGEDTFARLRELKQVWDPAATIRANHPVA